MKDCKFCKKECSRLYFGYCHNCYDYFQRRKYETWYPSQYGELARVNQIGHPQYNMPICHICGRAYTKLQQHIYYSHNMSKKEYCKKFGLEVNINMTTLAYNRKMHNYALAYNMDEQLIRTGKDTRFQKGVSRQYGRSSQTKEILRERLKRVSEEYREKQRQMKQEAIDYINSLDEPIKNQTKQLLNGPVENLTIDQLKLKCTLLGYDINRKIKF